jgi:hypothetical protein
MNMHRVRRRLFANCARLLARFGRDCKSYVLNNKAELDWAEVVWMEATAELDVQQGREGLQPILTRNR